MRFIYYILLGSKYLGINVQVLILCMLANREEKYVQFMISKSQNCVRHCSCWFKSRFKNYQAAERKIQNLQGSTDRESYSAEF